MNSKANLHKLGVKKSHRVALKKNLVSDLIIYEHLQTTRAKAKSTVALFDKVVALAKRSTSQRELERTLGVYVLNKNAVTKLIDVLAKRFKDTSRGLVSMYKLQNRKGDGAEQVHMIVKGYVHRDLGKKVSNVVKPVKEDDKSDKKESKSTATSVLNDARGKSQVAGTVSKTKSKSRSGI